MTTQLNLHTQQESKKLFDLLGQSSPGMSLAHHAKLVSLVRIFSKNVRNGANVRVLAATLVAHEKGETFFTVGDKRINLAPSDLEAFVAELYNPQTQMDVYKHLQPTERGAELVAAWNKHSVPFVK